MNHQQILIRAIEQSGLTARDISNATGVSESILSRFINGKQDMKAGDYFTVLNFLPESAKDFAKSRLNIDGSTNLKNFIMKASNAEKAEVLFAIGHLLKEECGNNDSVELMQAL